MNLFKNVLFIAVFCMAIGSAVASEKDTKHLSTASEWKTEPKDWTTDGYYKPSKKIEAYLAAKEKTRAQRYAYHTFENEYQNFKDATGEQRFEAVEKLIKSDEKSKFQNYVSKEAVAKRVADRHAKYRKSRLLSIAICGAVGAKCGYRYALNMNQPSHCIPGAIGYGLFGVAMASLMTDRRNANLAAVLKSSKGQSISELMTNRDKVYEHTKMNEYNNVKFDADVIRDLAQANPAYVHESNEYGLLPIHMARHRDELGVLKRHGANIDAGDTLMGRTALMMAAKKDDASLMRDLVQYGANVNACDRNGWTALRYAIMYGCDNVVKWLIENGAYTPSRQTFLAWTGGENPSEKQKAFRDRIEPIVFRR